MSQFTLSQFVDLIHLINGGYVLPGISDEESEILLPSSDAKLYCQQLPGGRRFFFFACLSDKESLEESIARIEDICIRQRDKWYPENDIKASDAYMVYFWHISAVDSATLKRVIELEENEFYFKKFVFYYTDEEATAFETWRQDHFSSDQNFSACWLEMLSDSETNIQQPALKFLTRFLIKIPCVSLPFTASDLPDFEELVQAQLHGTREPQKREEAKNTYRALCAWLEEEKSDEEITAYLEAAIKG